MNAKVKDTLRSIAEGCSGAISGFSGTIASIMRMILFSRISVAVKSKEYRKLRLYDDCTILANGPSLKSAMENNEVRLKDVDVFCVNSFCESEYFWQVKPRFYFIIDDAFFNPTIDRTREQVANLIEALNKVDWDLYLCIPAHAIKGGVLKGVNNEHIKVLRFNTTTTEGYKWYCHMIYRMLMGMPRCQTVTNMALVTAIQLAYKNVYLYGADHSWTKDLRVDDANIVCYGDRHVYATNLQIIKLKYDIATLLRQYANMFEAHHTINQYAQTANCHIWNCTKDSFVDAYDRLK